MKGNDMKYIVYCTDADAQATTIFDTIEEAKKYAKDCTSVWVQKGSLTIYKVNKESD